MEYEEKLLKNLGYQVEMACDGRSAYEIVKASGQEKELLMDALSKHLR